MTSRTGNRGKAAEANTKPNNIYNLNWIPD